MEAEMLQRLGPHPHIVTQPWLVWWQVADVDMDDFVSKVKLQLKKIWYDYRRHFT